MYYTNRQRKHVNANIIVDHYVIILSWTILDILSTYVTFKYIQRTYSSMSAMTTN
jgi:hypothetical protein